jgi:hypothetical protein
MKLTVLCLSDFSLFEHLISQLYRSYRMLGLAVVIYRILTHAITNTSTSLLSGPSLMAICSVAHSNQERETTHPTHKSHKL